MKIIISIVALVLVLGQIAPAQAQLIVPGKSAGEIHLGMTRAAVYQQLGKPTQSWTLTRNAEAYTEDVWCQKIQEFSRYFTLVALHGKVVQIEVTNPSFRTANGFSTAGNFGNLRRLYPRMNVKQHLFSSDAPTPHLLGYGQPACVGYLIDDTKQGLAVTLRSQCDKVDYELPSLGPDSIIIHKAGTAALPILAGKWAAVEPRTEDDYLDEIKEWFAGGVYRPRSPEQIREMQKNVESNRGKN